MFLTCSSPMEGWDYSNHDGAQPSGSREYASMSSHKTAQGLHNEQTEKRQNFRWLPRVQQRNSAFRLPSKGRHPRPPPTTSTWTTKNFDAKDHHQNFCISSFFFASQLERPISISNTMYECEVDRYWLCTDDHDWDTGSASKTHLVNFMKLGLATEVE